MGSDGVGVELGGIVPVGVGDIGGVGVTGGVGVSHGAGAHQAIKIVSTRQPSLEPLLSLAIRQRSLPPVEMNGKLTTVVMNPSELPLQA
jgi:hypothetical protein